ncbi:hypothetical protein ACJMK2_028535 [Sinanodonta woodiana]|uniref:Uncharacterized protein n=1 Tax=Sinanodonta woodiana TaxID=1069815 RepID=A0ABD3X7F5_SINWO
MNATISMTFSKVRNVYSCGDDLNIEVPSVSSTILAECSSGKIIFNNASQQITTENPASVAEQISTSANQPMQTTIETESVTSATTTTSAISSSSITAYNVDEACYGSHQDDYVKPVCPAGHVIYVSDVYTYAKRKSTGCREESSYDFHNETYCCQYVNGTEDCGMRYSGLPSGFSHYVNCNGYNNCTVHVAWNYTLLCCDQNVYLARTNYMRMHYQCIAESSIVELPSAQRFGPMKEIHIRNVGYPRQIRYCNVTSGYLATITSSSGAIVIRTLDLRLAFNGTGRCGQKLHITILYNSTTNNITIRIDNTLSNESGNFWVKVTAKDTNATISMTVDKLLLAYGCGDDLNIEIPSVSSTILAECSSGKVLLVNGSQQTTTENPTSAAHQLSTSAYQQTPTTIVTESVTTPSSTTMTSENWSSSVTGKLRPYSHVHKLLQSSVE